MPATAVLPVAAFTVNLLVLTSKFPYSCCTSNINFVIVAEPFTLKGAAIVCSFTVSLPLLSMSQECINELYLLKPMMCCLFCTAQLKFCPETLKASD